MINVGINIISEEADLEKLIPLYHEDQLETFPDSHPTLEDSKKIIESCYKSQLVSLWLATVDGEPVGYGRGSIDGAEFCCEKIFVSKEHRNQGIGKKLSKARIDFAKEKGLKGIYSATMDDNPSSISMSKSVGMEECGNWGECQLFEMIF